MKRINACASDAQLSFDLSNSLLTPSFHNSHLRNKFKLTPIAVACVCALCSLSANAARDTPEDFKSGLTDIQRNALEQIAGQDTGNNRWTIGGEIDLSEIDIDFRSNKKRENDLIGFFREDDYNDNDLARVNITYLQDGVKWYHIAGDEEGVVSGKITHPNSVVYFNKGDNTTAWDVRYNFADDGDNLGIPSTQDTSVLSFFDNEKISASILSDLKIYIFEPQVNLISQNHLVGQNNSANSKADIGLSLSNKRKNITFNKEVNFISSFTFYDEGTDNIPVSGVNNAKIAASIYNAFGASDLESDISAEDGRNLRDLLFKKDSTETTDYANALGVITFNKYATVSVTHTNRDKYSDKGKINEVFGVFNNEGGTTIFENGANIIAKGKQNDRIISAISSTGTKGILDPLKQGTINITGSDNGKTSFIWGISDNSEESNSNNDFIKPFAKNNAYDFDIDTDWNNYFNQLNDSDNLELQYAVISLHGSNVNIKDTQNGAIDIRGDILSGTLNGDGATSNTVGNQSNTSDDNIKWSDLSGVVIRSNVSINLENEKSVLYGNVYERHRITEDELVDNTHLNTAESFKEWQDLQLEQERESLGGNVDLSLSNKATWYPQKNWKGWNNDFVYSDFEEQLENLPDDGVINYDEINYRKVDFSDQYNLMVYENDKWSLKNKSDDSKINDLNNKFSEEKKGEYTTVDNGIYHLALNDGGVVDTRYMRQDFNFSTVNDVIGNNMDYSQLDKGIKKLRIQELAGNGGTFNIFVENNDNHDLIIIDQAKENSSPTISFNIWNGENNTIDKTLGITKGNESTFVQIGRVGKDIQFNKTIEIEPQYGDIQKITYTIEEDNEKFEWTTEQHLEYHEAMNNLFITDYKFETAPEIIEGARISSSLAYNYAIMDIDRLQKRRGEARYITQQDDGMWARYRHINSGLSGNDDSADVIQIGYDHKVRNEESYNVYSVAVDYLRGQSDFDQSGDSEMNRYSLAVYDTWLLDNGAYLDLTARVGYFDAEMNTSFRMPSNTFYNVDGNYNFWGASVGAEIGRKFSNKDQWFFEPQTQLTYTYIGGYDFNTSQGVKVESDSIDSVIMRWGLRVGKDFGTSAQDGLYSVYLMADALHDFLGQQELTVTGMSTGNSHVAKFDGEQTWYDVGIGFSCTLNENSYIFLNYERSLGHSIDNTWEANAGVSVVF